MLIGETIQIDPGALFAGIAVVLGAAASLTVQVIRAVRHRNDRQREPSTAQWVKDTLKENQKQIAENAQAIASLTALSNAHVQRLDRIEAKLDQHLVRGRS